MKDPVLRCLVIANRCRNQLTDKGATTIAEVLEANTCLQTLVLFGTLMGDGAVKAITAAMERNNQLRVLVFYGKAISSRGISTFARWIKAGRLPVLEELVIGGSEFSDEDAQGLMQSISRRKKTQLVDDVHAPCPLLRFRLIEL